MTQFWQFQHPDPLSFGKESVSGAVDELESTDSTANLEKGEEGS